MRTFLAFFVVLSIMAAVMGLSDDICNQPTSADGEYERMCLAYIQSYSYDPSLNKCVEFIYGGCGGNDNRFPTLKACEDRCKKIP